MGIHRVWWACCDLCGESKSYPDDDFDDPPYGFRWLDRLLVCWDCDDRE